MIKNITLFLLCLCLLSLGSGKVFATIIIEEVPQSNLGMTIASISNDNFYYQISQCLTKGKPVMIIISKSNVGKVRAVSD